MNIWMIHEVTQKEVKLLKTLSVNNNIFIWDDAVLSQYDAILQLKKYKNILGVSTNIANMSTVQYTQKNCILYEPTYISHKRYHTTGNACAFMTWEHIKKLSKFCEIGAHGYNHTHISSNIKLEYKKFILECNKINEDFINILHLQPKTYIYPYNESYYWSDAILHKIFKWKTFGSERLDANMILFNKKDV